MPTVAQEGAGPRSVSWILSARQHERDPHDDAAVRPTDLARLLGGAICVRLAPGDADDVAGDSEADPLACGAGGAAPAAGASEPAGGATGWLGVGRGGVGVVTLTAGTVGAGTIGLGTVGVGKVGVGRLGTGAGGAGGTGTGGTGTGGAGTGGSGRLGVGTVTPIDVVGTGTIGSGGGLTAASACAAKNPAGRVTTPSTTMHAAGRSLRIP